MTSPLISFIIPVFNEKKRLKKGITSILGYLRPKPYSWEIIIVDDGSIDEATTKLYTHTGVFILKTKKNFGKGHAIRLGVEAATGQYIFFTDIDLSVPMIFTDRFLQELKNHDIVIGSRRLKDSKVTKSQNSLRRSLGHGFTQLSNFVLGLNHTDYTCGFKAFRGNVAKKLFAENHINRWAFDPEVMFLAHKYHYTVKERPVSWKNDPRTKVSLTPDILQSAFDLLRIRF